MSVSRIFVSALLLSAACSAAADTDSIRDEFRFSEITAPEHDYWNRELNDPFTPLIDAIEQGRLGIDASGEKAYLSTLLDALEIPASTQMLVFSTTSLQLSLISPRNPRSVYFNEDVYLGYVPGGKIEIVSVDPELGAIFYIFDIPRAGGRPVVERSQRCMNCHSAEDTRDVPGLIIKSVIPGTRGGSLESYRRGLSGHQIPFSDRFGGWHVTGAENVKRHWGNVIGEFSPNGIVTTPVPPGERFDWSVFPVATSDVLAHMLHEHQVGFVNRVVELHYRSRSFLEMRGHPSAGTLESAIDPYVDELVEYILFKDEAEFPDEGIPGDPLLKEEFLADRRLSADGKSLKDFDLRTRTFAHRCSYMIYSSTFQALPTGLKQRVYRRIGSALDTNRPNPDFAFLPSGERTEIRKILRETLPDLPADW